MFECSQASLSHQQSSTPTELSVHYADKMDMHGCDLMDREGKTLVILFQLIGMEYLL